MPRPCIAVPPKGAVFPLQSFCKGMAQEDRGWEVKYGATRYQSLREEGRKDDNHELVDYNY